MGFSNETEEKIKEIAIEYFKKGKPELQKSYDFDDVIKSIQLTKQNQPRTIRFLQLSEAF